jgi:hypothetical protein
MSTDKNGTYSDGQAVAAAFTSTNEIEHAGAGGRGPGPSQGLWLVISAKTAITGMNAVGSFTVSESDSNTDPTTSSVWAGSDALGGSIAVTQNVAAGTVIGTIAVPTITKKYSRVEAVLPGTPLGTVDCYFTDAPQANRS